jgi:hypothetical protein
MGRRAAELAGVLVASLITSFVTGLALAGPNEPALYIIGALVPLALLLAYWLWVEPRAEADRLRARRFHGAVDDAFELTQPRTDATALRDGARRAFYDRLEISDLFEPNHLEASSVLGEAFDAGKDLLVRLVGLDAETDVPDALLTDLEAWRDRTADQVEIARGMSDAMTFRQPTATHATADPSDRREVLQFQVQLLEVWTGDERRRAGERARDRYR